MGFMDFLKDVGSNIFGDGDQAEEITSLLNKELEGKIQNLQVEFDDGAVSLTGVCDSMATKEKAILLAGNIKGVAKVDGEELTSPPAIEPTVYYEVKKGDSLSKIAKHFYDDYMKYPAIFEANREVIKDPDLIYPGQKLRIPKQS
jgi:nucleoid-associated protein YgaU